MEEVINLVGNFGFPIAMTVYLLHRFEQKLDKLEIAIIDLAAALKK